MTQAIHLCIGFEDSQQFLRTWAAWRADPLRPRILHVVAICPASYRNLVCDDSDLLGLKPLADLLDAQLWGLLPGFHRLMFDGGHVLLTLCIGNVTKMLRLQRFEADLIQLNSAALTPGEFVYAAKAIARLSKPTTLLTISSNSGVQAALIGCGFVFNTVTEESSATYNPSWITKKPSQHIAPGSCVVVGAGLAGAAVASSLARRGWAVTVLDAAKEPASGASSLPAGLLVAHTSADDGQLSRLSRTGVRMTLQQARVILRHGIDWGHTGVLQRNLESTEPSPLPLGAGSNVQAASDWCKPASAKAIAAAGLPADTHARWHIQAGWIKPVALVKAWLGSAGVSWRGGVKVSEITPSANGWKLCDATGQTVAQAELVVVAAAYASASLVSSAGAAQPDLQAVRGQVTFGLQKDSDQLPPFAVNGHGSLITAVATSDGPLWLMGASYERDIQIPVVKEQDHAANLARLQKLLPRTADRLARQFSPLQARGWAGVRCATPNRLPLVGPIGTPDSRPGLWLCTGMGSRGLSFAALCAELLAAQLHGEPLPIDSQSAVKLRQIGRKKPSN